MAQLSSLSGVEAPRWGMATTPSMAAVSLLGENGKDVRGWLASRALPIRWAAMLGGTIAVLLLGVWGSGFSEASFIYFNF